MENMIQITANDVRDEIDFRIDSGILKPLQSMQAAKFSNNDIDSFIKEVIIDLGKNDDKDLEKEIIDQVINKILGKKEKKKDNKNGK